MDPLTDEILEVGELADEAIKQLADLTDKLRLAGGRLRARGNPVGFEFSALDSMTDWCRRELMSVRNRLAPHVARCRAECEAVG